MNKKTLLTVAFASGLFFAGCDSSPSAPDARGPQFDNHGKKPTSTTTTRTTTMQNDSTDLSSGGSIGDPCDPETYSGPYRCIPDPNNDGGYVLAT
jgi:hypothetical protein